CICCALFRIIARFLCLRRVVVLPYDRNVPPLINRRTGWMDRQTKTLRCARVLKVNNTSGNTLNLWQQ
ncbi:hypothetical protein GBAR_LOCUS22914, partial [Geodia barretti]